MKKFIFVLFIAMNQLLATTVVLETTQGNIHLKLVENVASKAVENFTTLVKRGFYDGIIFHRIIKNFMVQSGDPTGTGRGGSSIWGKPFEDENFNAKFDRAGILAMANRGPNTNGSQFFITTVPTPHLNRLHTIFGYVANKESFDVLKKLEEVRTSGRYSGNKPKEEQKIIKAYIL